MMMPTRSSPSAVASGDVPAAPGSVLVVERPGPFLSCLRIMLTALEYDVTVASTADEAGRLVPHTRPKLILVSLDLPEAAGTSLTMRLCDLSRAPLVLISRKGQEQHVVANLEAGAQDFIARPFEIETLEKRLRNALRRHAASAQTVSSI
jgi:DNA-binding response OmpR family regulator